MPSITIDGTRLEVEDGLNLILAAERLGIEIPHYCYHPDLRIDGNCRMCLVEVEGARGPQIACNTPLKDGLVVRTNTKMVEKMRRGVLEFLLLNHPIDCPICDQAGECRLQDYYMKYGKYDNRLDLGKVRKQKVLDIGPLVVLDQERCVLCSRCVRFCSDITGTHELVITGRGDRSRVEIFSGKKLDNLYSGNVVDICPVGALTSKDFRFQKRVWFLQQTPSICAGCARGCSIVADHHQNTIYRYRARHNPHVNGYWICDIGRMSYRRIQENRLQHAQIGKRPVTLAAALQAFQVQIKGVLATNGPQGIGALASPHASLEDNYALKLFVEEEFKSPHLWGANWTPDGIQDDLLLRADKTPNRQGLALLGIPADRGQALQALRSGQIKLLILLQNDLAGEGTDEVREALHQVDLLIYCGTHRDATAERSHIVFPVATHAESFGTFVNFQGRLQKFQRSVQPADDVLPGWDLIAQLGRQVDPRFGCADVEAVWQRLSTAYEPLRGLSFYGVSDQGIMTGLRTKD